MGRFVLQQKLRMFILYIKKVIEGEQMSAHDIGFLLGAYGVLNVSVLEGVMSSKHPLWRPKPDCFLSKRELKEYDEKAHAFYKGEEWRNETSDWWEKYWGKRKWKCGKK